MDVAGNAAVLVFLCRRYAKCMQHVDVACEEPWSIGTALREVAHLLFPDSTADIVNSAIEATWNNTGSRLGNVILEQAAAVLSVEQGLFDLTRSKCLFVQVFEKLQPLPPVLLRSKLDEKDRLFRVYFKGVDGEYERGVDWGGLYRDTMTRVTVRSQHRSLLRPVHVWQCSRVCVWLVRQEDLFSDHFNLFVRCPNFAQHAANADTFLPNPAHLSKRALDMFEFVGKLMGISVRHRVRRAVTLLARHVLSY